MDLTKPESLAEALSELPVGFNGIEDSADTAGDKAFSTNEVKDILRAAASQDMKDVLKRSTQEALDQGAFGAPWLWVTNVGGEGEPFFGSDRYVAGLALLHKLLVVDFVLKVPLRIPVPGAAFSGCQATPPSQVQALASGCRIIVVKGDVSASSSLARKSDPSCIFLPLGLAPRQKILPCRIRVL